MTCILAIDPGITGALAFYFTSKTDRIGIFDMPIVDGNVDPHALKEMIRNFRPDWAIIEHVHCMPKEGVSSVWRFSAAFTTACVVVKLMNIPLVTKPSTVWKRAMHLKGGTEGKEQARGRAIELFPLSAQHFARKKDHNRADAAMLAVYAASKLPEVSYDRVSTSQPVEP